jgi:hypothetical protein
MHWKPFVSQLHPRQMPCDMSQSLFQLLRKSQGAIASQGLQSRSETAGNRIFFPFPELGGTWFPAGFRGNPFQNFEIQIFL